MAVIKSETISAENTFSARFKLEFQPALICATRDDSTVTLRRYAASTGGDPIAALDLDSTMNGVDVIVGGWYDIGVVTGNYGGTALTLTVEQ